MICVMLRYLAVHWLPLLSSPLLSSPHPLTHSQLDADAEATKGACERAVKEADELREATASATSALRDMEEECRTLKVFRLRG